MMKNFIILIVSIFAFTSCSNDDDEITHSHFIGEWNLVRTTGQFEGSESTGAEMEWQESYTLRADGTFTKTRLRDNETSVTGGTYTVHNDGDWHPGIAHISMVYEAPNNLIATCYSDKLQEELYFETDELMVSTWKQCDGLGLEYAKKEN